MKRRQKRFVTQLIHPVSIIQYSETKGSMGGPAQVESEFLSCRAAIWPVKGNEAFENMRTETEVTHRVRIRYYPGVTSKMSVKFGTRYFEIKWIINPDEANKVLDLVSMSGSNISFEWFGDDVKKATIDLCMDAATESAKRVEADAKRRVPEKTGGIKRSIETVVWKKETAAGAFVKAGEKNREHIARFVELGTPGEAYKSGKRKGEDRTPIEASPYLRPALKKEKARFRRKIKRIITS